MTQIESIPDNNDSPEQTQNPTASLPDNNEDIECELPEVPIRGECKERPRQSSEKGQRTRSGRIIRPPAWLGDFEVEY